MCAGTLGVSYLESGFFDVVPGVALWGGDINSNSGEGNYIGFPQVYLPYPPLQLVGPGYLAGTPHRDGFGSQFIMTLDESGLNHLSYRTIFGRVRNPESDVFNALRGVGGYGPGVRSRPGKPIEVIGCGVLL
ncbi:hypothetical protein BS47DRAFT_1402595 [Hydnum rufescens UP504]|uniref:PPIase cyclophilin-type domain-containing protein n=1 Tax=Hydnum rufescens UP504 TaxID=1448309 RepID=A0A9P6DEV8_9AGAM|nr:hypothetical protein BS47DRAFT_1402595 [Hydnum rufescens UP504]